MTRDDGRYLFTLQSHLSREHWTGTLEGRGKKRLLAPREPFFQRLIGTSGAASLKQSSPRSPER